MADDKGFLTSTDRGFLRGEKEYNSKQGRYARRQSIRERTRGALRDFHLLADRLDKEERDKIFAGEPRSDERRELTQDVMKVVEFLYTGMGGESGFRQPLEGGVANGELALGNVEHAFDIVPQFSVDRVYQADSREITDLIEAEEWDRLNERDLFTFIRLAYEAKAIDFDAIRDRLDLQEWSADLVGKKRRAIPGGRHTPLMDPEIYNREGIGKMSGEELRELFGEGYSAHSRIIYDGEKVITTPKPGSDEDPEIIDCIDGSEEADDE